MVDCEYPPVAFVLAVVDRDGLLAVSERQWVRALYIVGDKAEVTLNETCLILSKLLRLTPTFVKRTGAVKMREIIHTTRTARRQLLMVHTERDRIGNTITMNLLLQNNNNIKLIIRLCNFFRLDFPQQHTVLRLTYPSPPKVKDGKCKCVGREGIYN